MNSLRVTGTSVAVTLLAACGSHGKGPLVKPDSMQSVTFSDLTGRVDGADSSVSHCPVRPHFEAGVTVAHMQGTLRYRWTVGDTSIQQVDIPAAAKTGAADITLKPDEWASAERGVQLALSNKVHILSPIDRVSPPIDLQVICY